MDASGNMSSSSFEMQSTGMASGFVVLLELRAGLALGVDVENDAVGVLDGKASISPRMVFKWHDGNQARSREGVKLSIDIGNAEVVGQADRIARGLIGLRRHELKRRAFSKLEIDVPAAVEGDLRTKMLDVEITGRFNFRCDDAGGK
jgi:hypothetical protein